MPTANDTGWRGWLSSSASLRVERVLVVCDALGVLVAAAVVIAATVGGHPLGGAGGLLVLGIPLIVAGQLCTIGILILRNPPVRGSFRERVAAQRQLRRNSLTYFYGQLPRPAAWALMGLAELAIASAIVAAFGLHGGAGQPSAACPWPLVSHGLRSCVSHTAYLHSLAAAQRFAASIVAGFLSLHLGVLVGEVVRRRQNPGGGTESVGPGWGTST